MGKLYVTQLRVDHKCLFARTDEGLTASYDLSRIRGFRNATPDQLDHFVVVDGKDVYWPQLDEDINLEGMFYDNHLCPLTPTEDSVVYCHTAEGEDYAAEPLCNND